MSVASCYSSPVAHVQHAALQNKRRLLTAASLTQILRPDPSPDRAQPAALPTSIHNQHNWQWHATYVCINMAVGALRRLNAQQCCWLHHAMAFLHGPPMDGVPRVLHAAACMVCLCDLKIHAVQVPSACTHTNMRTPPLSILARFKKRLVKGMYLPCMPLVLHPPT